MMQQPQQQQQQQQQQQHSGSSGGHHHHHHHHAHSLQQSQPHSQPQSVSQSSGSRQQAAAAAQQSQRAPAGNAPMAGGPPPPPSQQQQQQQQHHHHHHHHHASQQASQPPAHQLHPIPSIAGTGGSSSHHHHHHHHNGHGQQRSKKDLQFLAGLPSQDRESYYDSGPSGVYGSDDADDVEYSTGLGSGRYEHGDASAEFEGDCSSHSIAPKLSNRGNKLLPGAQHVKKGRLGGWENHEIFTSRSAFPSNNNYPSSHTTNKLASLSGLPGASGSRPRQGGATGFTVTPNLSLVPTSSTAAARPDRDIHISSSVPSGSTATGLQGGAAIGPDGLVVGGGTLPDYPSKKRRKIQTSHTGLASTSGPSANYTSCPVRAYLPIPPQNPIELVSSPLVSRTFNPRNKTLEKLSLSATELIEQDMELLRALTRLVDFLRGNSIAGLQGIVGLPFSGGDGQATERANPEQKQELEGEREREQGQTSGMRRTDATASEADAAQNENGQALLAHPGNGAAAETETPKEREQEGYAMQVDGASATAGDGAGPEPASQGGAAQAAPATSNGVSPGVLTNGSTGLGNGNGVNGTGGKDAHAGDGDSRAENGAGPEQEEEGTTKNDTAPLAPALQRIAHPYPYIESLFVSQEDIWVPLQPHAVGGGMGEGTPVPGQPGAPAAGGGAPAPAEPSPSTHARLRPSDQLSTVQLCLSELTKFLSDSLEYQDRLSEIRDSVLGVEKRRKGVWNMARMYAHQLVWEEEQEKNLIAHQQAQQQLLMQQQAEADGMMMGGAGL